MRSVVTVLAVVAFGSVAFVGAKVCLRNEFTCKDASSCVGTAQVCDGVPHCRDHSDERNCTQHEHCEETDKFFTCKSGDVKCVAKSWTCDQVDDCDDGSDEADCPTAKENVAANSTCQDYEFRCENGLCIPDEIVCDDIKDCTDGSDEEPGMCNSRPCKDDQFECGVKDSKKCIPLRWKCDGKQDCTTGEDEKNCHVPTFECANGTFDCHDNKTCIPLDKVCDGSKDCPNDSDETEKCLTSCKGHSCREVCVKSPTNTTGTCACHQGKELEDDGKSCKDVDECEIEGSCSQICKNVVGSYKCSCLTGYRLDGAGNGNGRQGTCRAESRGLATVFFAGRTEIGGLKLEKTGAFSVTKSVGNAVGIAFDAKNRRVFWSDTGYSSAGAAIVSANMDGSDVDTSFVTSGLLMMPEGLALDHVARNLYFAESIGNFVGVCSLEKKFCARLYSRNVFQPREIALYPLEGLLFFTDWGLEPKINRIGMDGSHPLAVVDKELHWPNGVAVDVAMKRIYWSDAKLDLLESAGLDGSGRRRIEVNVLRHPFSLAVFEDDLYWSDWELKTVQACDKFSGENFRTVLNGTDLSPMGIHVYHPVMESGQVNPCRVARCSHLCLLAHGGRDFACKCPDDMYLDLDRTTCKRREISPLLRSGSSAGETSTSSASPATSTTVGRPVVEPDQPDIVELKRSKKLKLGLGIAVVVLVVAAMVGCYCVYSSRGNKCESSRVMRYKNPVFGHDESNCSDDVDFVVEKNPDEKLTSKLQMWPDIEGGKHDSNESEKSPSKNGLLGFKVWKARTQGRYYKL